MSYLFCHWRECQELIVYFSLQRILGSSNRILWLESETIYLAKSSRSRAVISLKKCPFTFETQYVKSHNIIVDIFVNLKYVPRSDDMYDNVRFNKSKRHFIIAQLWVLKFWFSGIRILYLSQNGWSCKDIDRYLHDFLTQWAIVQRGWVARKDNTSETSSLFPSQVTNVSEGF